MRIRRTTLHVALLLAVTTAAFGWIMLVAEHETGAGSPPSRTVRFVPIRERQPWPVHTNPLW